MIVETQKFYFEANIFKGKEYKVIAKQDQPFQAVTVEMIDTTGGINKQEFTNPYEFFKWLASF
jgi:PleD family two-component response regulator